MTAIRKYRAEKGLTQKELAEIMGCSISCIGMWETGERNPSIFMLKKLSQVLQCTTDDLLAPISEVNGR